MSAEPAREDALAALLAALSADRDEAGRLYEALRARLIDMFRWRGLARADELADTALDRAARKLAEGAPLTATPAAFVAGFARNIALEASRAAKREVELHAEQEAAAELPTADPAADRCLEGCLAEQPPGARDLLLRYLTGEGRTRIDARRRLAEDLGIELNALRVRAHRVRTQVEACLRECLGNESGPGGMEKRA